MNSILLFQNHTYAIKTPIIAFSRIRQYLTGCCCLYESRSYEKFIEKAKLFSIGQHDRMNGNQKTSTQHQCWICGRMFYRIYGKTHMQSTDGGHSSLSPIFLHANISSLLQVYTWIAEWSPFQCTVSINKRTSFQLLLFYSEQMTIRLGCHSAASSFIRTHTKTIWNHYLLSEKIYAQIQIHSFRPCGFMGRRILDGSEA